MKTLAKKIIRQGAQRVGGLCGNAPGPGARILSATDQQIFFGYYDVTPFSHDGNLLLATRAPAENASPHDRHPPLEVGFFDLREENPAFRVLGTTASWNWQQGCRLQWFDNSSVIYNTPSGSVIQDIKTGKITRNLPLPVYALDKNRHFALTTDFTALHNHRRGYGYNNMTRQQDGITRLDLNIGETRQILPQDAIRKFFHAATAADYINHIAFNPAGTRFLAFYIRLNGQKRETLLLTANTDGSGLYAPAPGLRPSHYCWKDDNEILLTGTKDGAVIYCVAEDKTDNLDILQSPHLREDGHPSVMKNGAILSDTYPDIFGRQNLFLYDPQKDTRRAVASFYSPPGFAGEMRCDLHPRLSPAQDKICVDIVENNRRALCVLPVGAS